MSASGDATVVPAAGDTYTCARCGETFVSEWSNEEALAEANALWTADELKDTAVVCEDCFQAFYAWHTGASA